MLDHNTILQHIDDIFGQDMHAKRVLSLANATQGVLSSGSLAIHAIGNGLSVARSIDRKHAVKQVDRLLTNTKLSPWQLFHDWVPYVVAERQEIVVSMDWIVKAILYQWQNICTSQIHLSHNGTQFKKQAPSQPFKIAGVRNLALEIQATCRSHEDVFCQINTNSCNVHHGRLARSVGMCIRHFGTSDAVSGRGDHPINWDRQR